MTTHDIADIPNFIIENIDHVVNIEEYSNQNLEMLVSQRIKYCNLEYEEEVSKLIVESGNKQLHEIIRMLRNSITVMMANDRNTLTVEDVKQAMTFT